MQLLYACAGARYPAEKHLFSNPQSFKFSKSTPKLTEQA
jgi:hypothetical protein